MSSSLQSSDFEHFPNKAVDNLSYIHSITISLKDPNNNEELRQHALNSSLTQYSNSELEHIQKSNDTEIPWYPSYFCLNDDNETEQEQGKEEEDNLLSTTTPSMSVSDEICIFDTISNYLDPNDISEISGKCRYLHNDSLTICYFDEMQDLLFHNDDLDEGVNELYIMKSVSYFDCTDL